MWLLSLTVCAVLSVVAGAGAGAARLVCYVDGGARDGFSECTHLVYSGDARGEKLEGLLKEYKKLNPRLKIVLRVAEVDKVSIFLLLCMRKLHYTSQVFGAALGVEIR